MGRSATEDTVYRRSTVYAEHWAHSVFKLVWSNISRETMHVLTVEEEPQEGMTPGDGNDREYMGRVRFAWSK